MKDFQKAMKLSLLFGLGGAVLLPLLYECYANIARTGALVLIAAWAVFIGIKLSRLDKKAAVLAATTTLFYTAGLGLMFYILVHPYIVKFLEKNSKYFYLKLEEQAAFVLYAFLLMLLMYGVCFAVWGVKGAARKIKNNNELAASYIENAFDGEEAAAKDEKA